MTDKNLSYRKSKATSNINKLPCNKHKKHFVYTKCSKKIFFEIFIKKYGLDWSKSIYSHKDLIWRYQLLPIVIKMVRKNKLKKHPNRNYKNRWIIEKDNIRIIICKERISRKWQKKKKHTSKRKLFYNLLSIHRV